MSERCNPLKRWIVEWTESDGTPNCEVYEDEITANRWLQEIVAADPELMDTITMRPYDGDETRPSTGA